VHGEIQAAVEVRFELLSRLVAHDVQLLNTSVRRASELWRMRHTSAWLLDNSAVKDVRPSLMPVMAVVEYEKRPWLRAISSVHSSPVKNACR
jgi:hypothetical protein